MSSLSDVALDALVHGSSPVVRGLPHLSPTGRVGWQGPTDPIQPNSIDLGIGRVFVPGASQGTLGSASAGKTSHVLRPGETALVQTRETLVMPSDMCAIGFPPARLSISGVLITNPGLVDPGYGRGTPDGKPLHCTVINMGQEPLPLRAGDAIMTLVFFRLDAAAKFDFATRNPSPPPTVTEQLLSLLSSEFANLTNEINSRIDARQWRQQLWTAVVSAGLAGLIGVAVGLLAPWENRIGKLENQIDHLQAIHALDDRVKKLEGASNASGSTPAK